MGGGADGFSSRLLRRRALWWGHPFRWGSLGCHRDALHRLRERHTFRDAADPESVWRCCGRWQRTLVNKWNGREFVRKHGGRLPELYWRGRRIWRIPFETLPPRFVIRPAWGTMRQGVHVVADGRDLLRDEPVAAAELKRRLLRERGPFRASPVLVEQFVTTEKGEYRLPVEYKCHAFGDTVAAIQVVERTGARTGIHRYYTPAWETFEDIMDTAKPLAPPREAPPCLAEMLLLARRLGHALGTYMRIDFFSTDRGCVFNEFSSTPQVGGLAYTPFCDDLFAALWREKFADAS